MAPGPFDTKKGVTHIPCGADLGDATGLAICPNCKKAMTPANTKETDQVLE
jgi:hypothetical protein